jgi:VanZ family protein
MVPTSALLQRLAREIAAGAAAARTWRALLMLLIVAICYLSLTPKPPESIDFGWDKLDHVLAFTALAFSASLGYRASHGTRLPLLCALLAFGGLIEVFQLFVPGRSSEWGDLLADSIGIACGAVIAAYVLRAASTLSMRGR